jgi:hypothetical protein
MTVALVWTLLVWGVDLSPQNARPFGVIDAFPTKQHCEAMAQEVKRRTPGFYAPRTACVQRQIVVASK